ncbi:aspartyl-phosphate phosphatase Spo0E family protein [Alkalihalobacillus sp. MEB130]|uniref:aspartyl-phosphate phosphatase Spo0E family protein n=1 Tax=Alkalihalobacillus sp. MEB130 TaxID=2976704 RepID=UPI0028DE56B5|nr:aspartyl-phosphate phosphatase Spo0E family protein [Alkalihalobacillus sp. MEB130]MDT8862833.1 aspartyl-phosphate phosphatase Spo0E family protein [Alkalihalobacillus sp. MEB130]
MSEGLRNLIEKKRIELIELALIKGLSSHAVLTVSQELDTLLNHYEIANNKENQLPK